MKLPPRLESEERDKLHQRDEDAVEADSREVQVPAASHEKNRRGGGDFPAEEPAGKKVKQRNARRAPQRGDSPDTGDRFSEGGNGHRHGIEGERRHLARVGHENRPVALENPLRDQDVLHFVEEAARREAVEGRESESGRAQKGNNEEGLFPREEHAGMGSFSVGPRSQQDSGAGSENDACEKKRDPLLGQLLSEPRLPRDEGRQAGQDEDSAESPSPEGVGRNADHSWGTVYNFTQ